jgi:hypothetical protein
MIEDKRAVFKWQNLLHEDLWSGKRTGAESCVRMTPAFFEIRSLVLCNHYNINFEID